MKLVLTQPKLDYHARDNAAAILAALSGLRDELGRDDVVLLPEHWDPDTDGGSHEERLGQLARALGCHVVGGSHHRAAGDRRINTGSVVGPDGSIVGTYEKLRPYATERTLVEPGTRLGELTVAGRRMLILVCADFWFSDLIDQARALPDVILVPALSVSRKHSPAYSRAMWQHLAVSRAYELGTFVGVSDWSNDSALPALRASGVAGLADPSKTDATELYQALGDAPARLFHLDFDALEAFREDRRSRGFFWRSAP